MLEVGKGQMTRRADHNRSVMPLYPSEQQIARAVLGPGREKDWPSVAAHDELRNLPKIDPVHGGRYWPAVRRFYDKLNHLDDQASAAGPSTRRVRIIDTAPDGEEDFSGEKDAALQHRRRDRRPVRQRA